MKRGGPLNPASEKRLAAAAASGERVWSTLRRTNQRERKVATAKPRRERVVATKRCRPAVPPAVKRALIARSDGGWCEIQKPLTCQGQGVDPSHRIGQKAGGRHGEAKLRSDRLSNLMWACRACHDFVTNNPAAAKSALLGWALEEWQDPPSCPAVYRGVLSLLGDDGSVRRWRSGDEVTS